MASEFDDARVFDCFTFFNEILLLKARVDLLKHVVDRFVIVEGSRTYQGDPREPVFPSIAGELELGPSIEYVLVEDFPLGVDAWGREKFQRDAILRGLAGAGPNDLVVVSDVDEIPRPEVIASLRHSLEEPVELGMTFSYYSVNLVARGQWAHARACRRSQLSSPQSLRRENGLPRIPDAGWHLSFLGSSDRVAQKLRSFAHTEYATDRWTSEVHIRRCMRLGVRLFGETVFDVAKDDDCIPTIRRSEQPELFHPGRSRLESLLARAYRISASHRDSMPNVLNDRLPVLAFTIALVLHARDWLRWRLGRRFARD